MGKAVRIRVMSSMIPTYVNDKVDIRHLFILKTLRVILLLEWDNDFSILSNRYTKLHIVQEA